MAFANKQKVQEKIIREIIENPKTIRRERQVLIEKLRSLQVSKEMSA